MKTLPREEMQAINKYREILSFSCCAKGVSMIEYKVVELSVVTDETIEQALNDWTAQGWHFDSTQFVIREASKRPSMAFLLFAREAKVDQGG